MNCSRLSVIKKQNLHHHHRRSNDTLHFGLGCGVGPYSGAIQLMIDNAPKAKWYYSDGFDAYARLWYHFGRYEVSEGKVDTYSVEGDNAELRHYRLA